MMGSPAARTAARPRPAGPAGNAPVQLNEQPRSRARVRNHISAPRWSRRRRVDCGGQAERELRAELSRYRRESKKQVSSRRQRQVRDHLRAGD